MIGKFDPEALERHEAGFVSLEDDEYVELYAEAYEHDDEERDRAWRAARSAERHERGGERDARHLGELRPGRG